MQPEPISRAQLWKWFGVVELLITCLIVGIVSVAIIAIARWWSQGVTPSNYHKIQEGMTPAQVSQILGHGEDVTENFGNQVEPGPQIFVWDAKQYYIRVDFRHGRAFSKLYGQPCYGKPPKVLHRDSWRATTENLARIRAGMTMDEVQAILGEADGYSGPNPGEVVLVWPSRDSRMEFHITFQESGGERLGDATVIRMSEKLPAKIELEE